MEKNKLMMIIIIALLVLLLASVVGISIFALKMLNAPPEEGVEEPSVAATLTLDMIQLVPVESQITTNLKQSSNDSARHGIRTGLAVGLNKSDEKSKEYQALLELIIEKETVVRDRKSTRLNSSH